MYPPQDGGLLTNLSAATGCDLGSNAEFTVDQLAWGNQETINNLLEASRLPQSQELSLPISRKGINMQLVRMQKGATGSTHSLRRPRILLIDEDLRDRDHYRRMLHDSGFEVRTCSGFAEGANLLGNEQFDCIVVDQGGPNFRGRLVLEDSVAKDRYRPVVILSHYHDVGCYLEAMQLGAVDYLEKPVTALEIVRVVTTHIQPNNAAA